MAKNPFWLRGVRGKFAGAVVQKGADGGTIIRENVNPRNPRTMAQMLTRLAFAVVNQAAAAFDPLINHAFEGVKVGKDSRRRFVAVNVSRIKAYAQMQMEDPSLTDIAAFNPKGLSRAIPNRLIISRGSISRADCFRIYRGEEGNLLQISFVNPRHQVFNKTKKFAEYIRFLIW